MSKYSSITPIPQTTTTPPDQQYSNDRNNLFLIKSKHAFRTFKNHDYFQSRRADTHSQEPIVKDAVQTTAPYGINNTYRYICTEASRIILKNQGRKSFQRREKRPSMRKTCHNGTFGTENKLKIDNILPSIVRQSRTIQKDKNTLTPLTLPSQPRSLAPHSKHLEQNIQFLFYDKDQPIERIGNYQMTFNIINYILNTFLKSKISYAEMSEEQFTYLKSVILETYGSEKGYVEYKDMVNIRSMKEIFQQLQGGKEAVWKRELIRYFFIANQTSYEYQLERIKDKLKQIIEYQFNKDVSLHQLYIFDTTTGKEVLSLMDLMENRGRYVFGVCKNVIDVYNNYVKERQAQEKMASRIQKWKNIAPKENTKSECFKAMNDEKYQKLFDTVQKKRKGKWNRRKPISTIKSQNFIDRDKLFKDSNIFQ